MRVPGWCEKCHKIRTVRVSHAGMLAIARGGTPSGICDHCQEQADERRR